MPLYTAGLNETQAYDLSSTSGTFTGVIDGAEIGVSTSTLLGDGSGMSGISAGAAVTGGTIGGGTVDASYAYNLSSTSGTFGNIGLDKVAKTDAANNFSSASGTFAGVSTGIGSLLGSGGTIDIYDSMAHNILIRKWSFQGAGPSFPTDRPAGNKTIFDGKNIILSGGVANSGQGIYYNIEFNINNRLLMNGKINYINTNSFSGFGAGMTNYNTVSQGVPNSCTFRNLQSVSSASSIICRTKSSTGTTTDTTIDYISGTTSTFQIYRTSSSIVYIINGVTKATHTTNLPSGTLFVVQNHYESAAGDSTSFSSIRSMEVN